MKDQGSSPRRCAKSSARDEHVGEHRVVERGRLLGRKDGHQPRLDPPRPRRLGEDAEPARASRLAGGSKPRRRRPAHRPASPADEGQRRDPGRPAARSSIAVPGSACSRRTYAEGDRALGRRRATLVIFARRACPRPRRRSPPRKPRRVEAQPDQQMVHLPPRAQPRHDLLTDITTLVDRDRPLETRLGRQHVLVELGPERGNAGLDPQHLEQRGVARNAVDAEPDAAARSIAPRRSPSRSGADAQLIAPLAAPSEGPRAGHAPPRFPAKPPDHRDRPREAPLQRAPARQHRRPAPPRSRARRLPTLVRERHVVRDDPLLEHRPDPMISLF